MSLSSENAKRTWYDWKGKDGEKTKAGAGVIREGGLQEAKRQPSKLEICQNHNNNNDKAVQRQRGYRGEDGLKQSWWQQNEGRERDLML